MFSYWRVGGFAIGEEWSCCLDGLRSGITQWECFLPPRMYIYLLCPPSLSLTAWKAQGPFYWKLGRVFWSAYRSISSSCLSFFSGWGYWVVWEEAFSFSLSPGTRARGGETLSGQFTGYIYLRCSNHSMSLGASGLSAGFIIPFWVFSRVWDYNTFALVSATGGKDIFWVKLNFDKATSVAKLVGTMTLQKRWASCGYFHGRILYNNIIVPPPFRPLLEIYQYWRDAWVIFIVISLEPR